MVLLRSCCCGCSLTQGTVGTGIVSVAESILYIGYGALCLNARVPATKEFEEYKEFAESYLYVLGIIAIVQGSLVLLTTVCLFCAIQEKRRSFLLPWIILRGALLILGFLGSVILAARGTNTLGVSINLLWLFLMQYLFIVVVSYYQTDMEQITDLDQASSPTPKTFFAAPNPQQSNSEVKSPYAMTTVTPAGTALYNPPPNPQSPKPAGQAFYPTQNYTYNDPQLNTGVQPQYQNSSVAFTQV